MAPWSESSMVVAVACAGTLPRYGFWDWVARALGLVVLSAGLMGRGVATEKRRGSAGIVWPGATAAEIDIIDSPNIPTRIRRTPLARYCDSWLINTFDSKRDRMVAFILANAT